MQNSDFLISLCHEVKAFLKIKHSRFPSFFCYKMYFSLGKYNTVVLFALAHLSKGSILQSRGGK